MKHVFTLTLLLLLTVASCRRAPDILTNNGTGNQPKETTSPFIIRSGTSFGECGGYCRTMLEVDSLDASFSEYSWGDTVHFPTKHQSAKLTPGDLQCLMSAVDSAAFMKLDSVIGCPDCADGGAEWIEIEGKGIRKRITFEFGHSVDAIQHLIDKVRLLRANFKGENNYVYQTWDWVQSRGGIAGVTLTPASTGYTQRAIYRSDGKYELYRNDSLIQSTTYSISQKEINGAPQSVIAYADQSIPQVLQLRSDTLELVDQCTDCFDHIWVKATSVCGR